MNAPALAVDAFLQTRVPSWHRLFQSLVAERSIFEHEHGIVALVESHLTSLDVEVARVEHNAATLEALDAAQRPISRTTHRYSLVARIPGTRSGRSLILNTHLDVVPEGDVSAWTHPPFSGHIDGDVLYGRGAMDDKAGVTIALAVIETVVRAPVPLAGDLVCQFVLEDETTGNGSLLCLDAGHRADAAVIIDGTRPNRAIDRHAGQLQFTVRVKGRPASVSVAHLAVNAADLVGRLVAHLTDRVAAQNARREEPWTHLPSPFQCVTQRLASEGAPLTVPENGEATCYMTFPPPWTLDTAQRFVRDEVETFARSRRLEITPTVTFDGFQAEPVASDAASLAALVRECAQTAGFGTVEVGCSTGTSDMRHFAAAGIPCLLYGPGTGFNPHRPNEHFHLADLPRMVRLFTDLARGWCGAG